MVLTFALQLAIARAFWSYKFKKCGLRYEVALCIKTGDICWWSGPYAPGVWNDGSIFKDGLISYLEPGEQVKTDRGYQARVEKYLSQREKPFTNFVCVFVRVNPNETLINPRQYSSFDRWF
jgi:hypothetical protein